jgi:hypothetical protein
MRTRQHIDALEKAPSSKREEMLKLISDYEIEVLEYNGL